MAHPTQSQSDQDEDERRPFLSPPPPPSPPTAHTEVHPAQAQAPNYQTIDRPQSPSSGTNTSKKKEILQGVGSDSGIASPLSVSSSSCSSSSTTSASSSASASAQPSDPETAAQQDPIPVQDHHSHHHRHHHRSHKRRRIQMLLAVLAQLGLFVFFGTLAGVTAKAPWVYPYSWHPICMGLYGFVATEAILLLQTIEKGSHKRVARTWHGLLHTLSFVFAVCGFIAIYVNKDLLHKEHFHTNHAYFGCAAVFIFLLQVIFGFFVAYAPRALYQCIGQARIVRIHRVAGYVSIAVVWATLWLAVLTSWMKKNFDHEWIFALGMGMLAVGLVGQVTPSRLYARRRTAGHHPERS